MIKLKLGWPGLKLFLMLRTKKYLLNANHLLSNYLYPPPAFWIGSLRVYPALAWRELQSCALVNDLQGYVLYHPREVKT